jgi:tetratricopeptide (TPR) repeat protein
MPRLRVGLRLLFAVIALALLLPCVASSWAVASKEDICAVDADLALGLEDYPAAIALHRQVLRAHNDNALAHCHLGFAYDMTGRKTDEINECLAAARLGLDKWDLFLNLGLAYLGQNDGPTAIKMLQNAVLLCAELGTSYARATNGRSWAGSHPTTHPLESICGF